MEAFNKWACRLVNEQEPNGKGIWLYHIAMHVGEPQVEVGEGPKVLILTWVVLQVINEVHKVVLVVVNLDEVGMELHIANDGLVEQDLGVPHHDVLPVP